METLVSQTEIASTRTSERRATTLTVSVIIPVFNEIANLRRLVAQVSDEAWTERIILEQVIIVDDCSDDGSAELADTLARETKRVSVIHHRERLGKNAGIRDGMEECTGSITVILDADILLGDSCLMRGLDAMAEDASLMGASVINEPLSARTWLERASRFQAIVIAEASHLGADPLLRVHVLRSSAISEMTVPDSVGDDVYIRRWLQNHQYAFRIQQDATVYFRCATGFKDFARQTLRGRLTISALDEAMPVSGMQEPAKGVSAQAMTRAMMREPLGFVLYVLWRVIMVLTPAKWWLPVMDYSRHPRSGSTKNL